MKITWPNLKEYTKGELARSTFGVGLILATFTQGAISFTARKALHETIRQLSREEAPIDALQGRTIKTKIGGVIPLTLEGGVTGTPGDRTGIAILPYPLDRVPDFLLPFVDLQNPGWREASEPITTKSVVVPFLPENGKIPPLPPLDSRP